MYHVFMYQKSVLTDWSHIMTGCGRVGQNRLLDQVELHTTGCVQFDPVFRTLRKNMNRLRFRFDPKREKNRTEPDLQTLDPTIRMSTNDLWMRLLLSHNGNYYICHQKTITKWKPESPIYS